MYIPFKQYIKTTFPSSFNFARDVKDQAVIEINTLRQVGLSRILKQFLAPKELWKRELPVQSIPKFKVASNSLLELQAVYVSAEGGHTCYLSPTAVQASPLKDIWQFLPVDSGVKIVKHEGGIAKSFSKPSKTGATYSYVSPTHAELMLVHALFYNLGMGPRLYNVFELEFANGEVHVAYCVQHIEGEICADINAADKFIAKIQELEKNDLIKLINWNGYRDVDFIPPTCNGNLIVDKNSVLKYVDLQNFGLCNYYKYLKDSALQAASASHFGQKSYIMGGKYLYQEIPGLNLTAKRSPATRYVALQDIMRRAEVTVTNNLVIDIGCNIGLMGAQYLKDGAAWLHGFDMPEVVPQTEKILLSIGCTRFSVSGLHLSADVDLMQHMPLNVRNNLPGCVISYLAIRGHIGWVKQLATLPWKFMIYEGHQEESAQMSRAFIEELKRLKECNIVSDGFITDANSTARYIAIIKAV